MKTQHTPGRWLINTTKRFMGGRGFAITAETDQSPEKTIVARVNIRIKKYDESVANAELIADAGRTATVCGLLPSELLAQRNELLEAFQKIANWELPETGEFWDKEKKKPLSYGAAYGSNGERDFIKSIAKAAINKALGNQ